MHYKKCRTELAAMRSEHGVLTRTEAILSKLQDQTNRRLVAMENKSGVAGIAIMLQMQNDRYCNEGE